MSDSCSSSLNNNQSVPMCDTKNYTTEEKSNKRKLTPEQYLEVTDKLREIEQIKCEARLVCEQINHINSEKQHLQNLLNMLHVMDSDDRTRNVRSRQRRSQKINANSHLN